LERTVETIAIWAVGWFSKPSEELTVVSFDLLFGELPDAAIVVKLSPL